MNKKIYLTILVTVFLFGSCGEDRLQLDNPNALTEDGFYQTRSDAIRATNAAYSSLQKRGCYQRWMSYVQDDRSDEATATPNMAGIPPMIPILEFTATGSGDVQEGMWSDHFEGIYRANTVLKFIPEMESISDDLKNRLVGEAKFLRGFYYFNLVKLFGAVPVITSRPNNAEESVLPRDPVDEVFDQIIQDFKDAQTSLPPVTQFRGTADEGRATWGAATGYLGKVYLYRGQYADAAAEFKKIIDSGDYELVDNYRDNHTEENENNKESLFEIQFKSTSGGAWGAQGDNSGGSEGSLRAQGNGFPLNSFYNSMPSQKLIDEFEDGDPRLDMTAYHPDGVAFDPEGDSIVWKEPEFAEGTFAWRKYVNNTYDPNLNNSGINIRRMRYADVLLMYAEALNETDGPAAALPYINEVRNRPSVDMPEYPTADYPADTKEDVFNIINHERMVELAGEQQRWDDLVRWDNAGKIDMDTFITKNAFDKSIHKLLPIPQVELDANPEMEPNAYR